MIRIRFFGPRELNQNYFSGEQYAFLSPWFLASWEAWTLQVTNIDAKLEFQS